MDPEQPPPDPPPCFDHESIDPTVLTLRFDQEAATRSAGLPGTEGPLDHLPWTSGALDGQWVIGAEDPFSEWLQFASSSRCGLQQNVPDSSALPGTDDDEFRFSEDWQDSTSSSSLPKRLCSSQVPDQTFVSSINSPEPSQSALHPEMDEYHLDSSKAPSNTSSDTGSPVITPTTSIDDQVPAVSASNKYEKAASATSSRKRTLDEMKGMTTTFPIRDNQPPASRTKKVYSPRRRKEVALARQRGVCVRCRFRKVSSNFPRPCQQCQKNAGSAAIARWICIKETFFDIRFGYDILFESFTEEFLQNEIGTRHGPQRKLLLGLTYDQNSSDPPSLPVMVQDYSPPDSEDETLYTVFAVDDKTFENIPSERYAIVPQEMPSMEAILNWVKMDLPAIERNPVQRLIIALKDFMSRYCEHVPPLPMHDLLAGSVKILKLVHVWRSNKKVVSGNGLFNGCLVSKAASSQILQIVKEGIRETEFMILKALEKPIYGASGPGEKNMIPLWACLWSLMLTYRDCMVVYKLFSHAKRLNTRQPGCSDFEMLVNASKHMYQTLTANYSALFRPSSPLYLDWSISTNFDLIGKSRVLQEAFNDLRLEVFQFYESSDQLVTEDVLLKSMVIAQEKRLMPNELSQLSALSQWEHV